MTAPSTIPRWLVAGLCVVAALLLAPTLPYVILALWVGGYATRIYVPLRRVFRGRRGISATVTVLLFVVVTLPLAAMIASLVVDAIALVQQLLESDQARQILVKLATGKADVSEHTQEALSSPSRIIEIVMNQGDRAWAIVQHVAGAAAHVLIGLFIFVSGVYAVLTEGSAWYAWVERHSPVDAATTRRFADAFVETGRGLAFGIVGAGLAQSVVATAAYMILDIPAALPLGMITLIFSVIPAVGTALVWAPVAAGLAMTGRIEAGIALAVIGVAVISTVDNLARPYLARRGQLQLPTYVVLIAMFGGVEIIGGWGLVLGPLAARLAKEAILVASEAGRTLPTPQP